jgi:hypothetical protein
VPAEQSGTHRDRVRHGIHRREISSQRQHVNPPGIGRFSAYDNGAQVRDETVARWEQVLVCALAHAPLVRCLNGLARRQTGHWGNTECYPLRQPGVRTLLAR